jgi:hypothetical protein
MGILLNLNLLEKDAPKPYRTCRLRLRGGYSRLKQNIFSGSIGDKMSVIGGFGFFAVDLEKDALGLPHYKVRLERPVHGSAGRIRQELAAMKKAPGMPGLQGSQTKRCLEGI